jgi:BirA family biotin operon repressor/biotin-[acetyl-CoA-carboxylase] ligase
VARDPRHPPDGSDPAAWPDWPEPRVVAVTGSTNADVTELARAGATDGTAVVAAEQTAGRGRLGRSWQTPATSGVAVSVLLRPAAVPGDRWVWLPLLAGLAVADLAASLVAVPVAVKWPNDVLLAGGKVAGVLAERVAPGPDGTGAAAVVGVGVNVTPLPPLPPGEPPLVAATSLAEHGSSATAEDVARGVLRALRERYAAWLAAAGDPAAGLQREYRDRCASLGRDVAVHLPGGGVLAGRAVDVDGAGRLVVLPAGGGDPVALAAGDVVHARVGDLPGAW